MLAGCSRLRPFDEVIVTTFTAGAQRRSRSSSSTTCGRGSTHRDVVAFVIILLTIIPAWGLSG
jgi:hypothetical protein